MNKTKQKDIERRKKNRQEKKRGLKVRCWAMEGGRKLNMTKEKKDKKRYERDVELWK